jgi:hypothetical protein
MIQIRLKAVLIEQVISQSLKMVIIQNGYISTTAAHKMVMWMLLSNFVNRRAVNLRLAHHLQLVKKGQSAVDGGSIDGRGFAPHPFINLVDGGMTVHATKGVQN